MRVLAATLTFSGLLAFEASGQTPDAVRLAHTAFEAGQFGQAAHLGEAQSTADGLALAARSVLAEAVCGEAIPAGDVLGRAQALAEAALEAEPGHVEARMQLAISLSLQTRAMGRTQAWRSGHGERARALVQSVLDDDPANAYAHGFMAVWHVEVVRRGGRMGAAMMDASLADGFGHYEAAARLAPRDAALHWQMARALTALNPRRHRERIDTALAAVAAADQETAVDQVMAARALRLSAAFGEEDAAGLKRLANALH
ncbi:MAG: hypothetical protein AAGH87_08655 [Pseudomonadota bacterium]